MFRSTRVSGFAGVSLAAVLFVLPGCVSTGGPSEAEKARQTSQKQAEAKYNVAVDHMNRGRTAMGLRELLQAEQLDPTDKWVQLALGEAYRRSNRPHDAVGHVERAMQLDPSMHSARLNLSGVYIQMAEYEKAAHHAQILVDDPTFATPWRGLTNLGWAQYRLGQTELARENLELAVQYNDHYWPAVLNLGILENEAGRRVEALSAFEQVVELRPDGLAMAEAHYRIAEILIGLGQQDKAVPHLVASAESKPSGKWGEKSEKYLSLLR